MYKRPLLALFLTLSAAHTVTAGAPKTMNYQGLLSDGGSPVADGNYSVVFTIYDAAAAGSSKWTETRNVSTSAGLFNILLGTVNAIEDTVFNGSARWMGIKVGADAEMTPRTSLSSVPYAARVATVDGASGGTITGATEVTGNDPGNQLSVTNTGFGRGGFFQIANGANTEPAVQGTHVGPGPGGSFFSDGGGPGLVAFASGGTAADLQGNVLVDGTLEVNSGVDSVIDLNGASNIARNWGADGNGENWRLWGASFGQLFLNDGNVANNRMVELSAVSGGGELELHSSGGLDYIKLDAGELGDNAAQLPVDAINALETHDEPGVASITSASDPIGGAASTVALRSILCPAAGYVLVTGNGTMEAVHNNGAFSLSTMFVSDTTGGAFGEPSVDFQVSGNAPSGSYSSPYSVQAIFQVGAGLTTFYLRGTSNVTCTATDNRLTLIYFSTAYGTVAASELPESGDDPADAELSADAERAATEKVSLERLTREIAIQQAKLAELAGQVEELQGNAPAASQQD